jgi:hypothetical protein
MKNNTVNLFLMLVAWTLCLGVNNLSAAQYLGETTWTVSKNQNEHGTVTPPQTFTFTGAITRMGTKNYTMQGYVNVPGDDPYIAGGDGVLIGNILYITLRISQKHTDTWRDTGVMQVQLNKNTLSGTFYEVRKDFDTSTIGISPMFSNAFSAGSLSLSGRRINLNPVLTPNYMLLQ